MKQTGKKTLKKPTSQSGVSVLFVLYALLILGVAGLAGWLYWQGMTQPAAIEPVLTAEISAPIEIPTTDKQKASPAAEEKKDADQEEKAEKTPPAVKEEMQPENTEIKPEKDSVDQKPAEKSAEATDETFQEPAVKQDDTGETENKEQQEPIASKKEEASSEQIPENAEDAKKANPEKQEAVTAPLEQTLSPADTAEETLKPLEQDTKELASKEKSAKDEVNETAKKSPAEKPTPLEKQENEKTPTFTLNQQESKSDAPLPSVPDPALTRKSDYGLLPIIGPDGRLPWRVYRKPFEDPLDRPRIAIVISEMGFSKTATRSAIQNLPGAVTLSFNPYSRDLQSWVEQARAAGHEVLLQLPMEPFGYPQNDPGDHSLLTSLTDKDNLKRLDWMLGRFTGYSGVTNQMGSKFTASPDDIKPILDVIKSRGLLFLDGRTSSKSVAGPLSAEIGIPVAINNRFLDHKANRATIDARLQDLERIARYTGTAVGIGYPYPVTLERISNWSITLARKGFVLVPISAAVNRQEIQ